MDYEKIIKDERGKIRIKVVLVTFSFGQTDIVGNHFRYDTHIWHTPKGKRSEIFNPYIATDAEILEAKTELWNLVKP